VALSLPQGNHHEGFWKEKIEMRQKGFRFSVGLRLFAVMVACLLALFVAGTVAPHAFAQQTRPATIATFYPVLHIHATLADPSCPQQGWGLGYDVYGYPELYTPSTGKTNCYSAEWDFGADGFTAYLWVPSSYANATVCLGFYNSSNVRVGVGCVDESQYNNQWARVQRSWGTISADITNIRWSSNSGETGTYVGLGCAQGHDGMALSYGGTLPKLPKAGFC
jgi:hypothetical protein